MAPYNLRWYEEAGEPLDYQLQATLSEHYKGPMTTWGFSFLQARPQKGQSWYSEEELWAKARSLVS